MVKVFFIVKRRWWEDEYRANVYATHVPTREIHYWKSLDPRSRKGMIMLYTDRPASSFWSNYVSATGEQRAPDWSPFATDDKSDLSTLGMAEQQKARLVRKLMQYIKAAGVESVRESDIVQCGIRDWGREPYAGANHTWRPGAKSWEVMADISAFALEGPKTNPNIHICGEALSDYQGFIEGSLRSAAHVLHQIDAKAFETKTEWLCRLSPGKCGCKARARGEPFLMH